MRFKNLSIFFKFKTKIKIKVVCRPAAAGGAALEAAARVCCTAVAAVQRCADAGQEFKFIYTR